MAPAPPNALLDERHTSLENDRPGIHSTATSSETDVTETPLTIEEISRLIDVYDESVGAMYPFVDIEGLKRFAADAYQDPNFRSALQVGGPIDHGIDSQWSATRDVQVIKLVLATALVAERGASNRLGVQLADSVENAMGRRIKVFQIDLKEVMIFTILVSPI